MKKIFAIRNQPISVDLVLLLMRIVCGYALMLHGWGKIQNPFHWMGPHASVPSLFQALAAVSEFGGGLALILGLLTRLGALGIGCTMTVAVSMHRFVFGDPFVSMGGKSYEPAAIYLLIALLFLVLGPGRFSLDREIFGH